MANYSANCFPNLRITNSQACIFLLVTLISNFSISWFSSSSYWACWNPNDLIFLKAAGVPSILMRYSWLLSYSWKRFAFSPMTASDSCLLRQACRLLYFREILWFGSSRSSHREWMRASTYCACQSSANLSFGGIWWRFKASVSPHHCWIDSAFDCHVAHHLLIIHL